MNRLHLRFEAPSASLREQLLGRAPGRATAIALLTLTAALTWGAAVAWQVWNTESELAGVRALLAAQKKRDHGTDRAAEPATPQLTEQQRQAWIQVARELNTPWAALLDALETGTPDNVALVSIEPDARDGSVRLQAEAATLDALLAYARELDAQPLFQSVDLVKHETNEQDINKPVRLRLDLRLKTPPAQRLGKQAAR